MNEHPSSQCPGRWPMLPDIPGMSFLALAAQRTSTPPEGPGDSGATQSYLGAQHPVDFSAHCALSGVPPQEPCWFSEIPGWWGNPQIKTQKDEQ